jgi:hypothetical protein
MPGISVRAGTPCVILAGFGSHYSQIIERPRNGTAALRADRRIYYSQTQASPLQELGYCTVTRFGLITQRLQKILSSGRTATLHLPAVRQRRGQELGHHWSRRAADGLSV